VEFTTVVAMRIQSLLDRRGLGAGSEDEDALSQDDPGMAALYASSIRRRIAVGSQRDFFTAAQDEEDRPKKNQDGAQHRPQMWPLRC
jgi:hypothetical protein